MNTHCLYLLEVKHNLDSEHPSGQSKMENTISKFAKPIKRNKFFRRDTSLGPEVWEKQFHGFYEEVICDIANNTLQ